MVALGMRSRIGTRRMRRHAFLEMIAPPRVLEHGDRDRIADAFSTSIGHDIADHPAVENQQLAAMSRHDATAELAWLGSIPTLVVSAEHDPIAPPPLGRALAHGIPRAEYTLLRGASHGVPIQEPERINTLLGMHLERARAHERLAG
jgi:pimeloyl-ACP methyl ester carboxylesterase